MILAMETKKTNPSQSKGKRTVVGSIFAGLFGALGAVYLINPTAGFFELIPDNLPVVGNLDEAAAVLLLISCLAYFGIDLGGLLGRKSRKEPVIDVEAEDR
jgi:hypothetical protein